MRGLPPLVYRLDFAEAGAHRLHIELRIPAPAAEQTLQELGLSWAQSAAMGDDWPDLPVMQRCMFACAPVNAHVEVLAVAHYVTKARGGDGAVRELCDLLMVASGRYVNLLEAYTQ